MIYFGGMSLYDKSLSAGNLSSFLIYGMTFINSVFGIDEVMKKLATSVGMVEMIYEIIDYKPKIEDNKEKGIKAEIEGEITAIDGEFTYPTKNAIKVVKNLNFMKKIK